MCEIIFWSLIPRKIIRKLRKLLQRKCLTTDTRAHTERFDCLRNLFLGERKLRGVGQPIGESLSSLVKACPYQPEHELRIIHLHRARFMLF